MKQSKNRKNLINKIEIGKVYEPIEAIKLLKEYSYVKFNESLEVAVNLTIDPKKSDQNVRGVLSLPKGIGKKIRVAVMAKGDKAKEASSAGADVVGDDDLAKQITDGNINFDSGFARIACSVRFQSSKKPLLQKNSDFLKYYKLN